MQCIYVSKEGESEDLQLKQTTKIIQRIGRNGCCVTEHEQLDTCIGVGSGNVNGLTQINKIDMKCCGVFFSLDLS